MIAISDSGSLIAFAEINQFDLFHTLFTQVIIPQAVYDEVVIQGQGRPGEAEAKQAIQDGWMVVEKVKKANRVAWFHNTKKLGRGESEVLALAEEQTYDTLVIDDTRANNIAKQMGLPEVRVFKLLQRAKQMGHISAIKPFVDDLISKGFFCSPALYQKILQEVGEQP